MQGVGLKRKVNLQGPWEINVVVTRGWGTPTFPHEGERLFHNNIRLDGRK